MKKISKIVLCSALLIGLISCESSSEKEYTVDFANKTQKTEFKVDASGSQFEFDIVSENEWIARTGASWLQVSPAKGEGGQHTVKVKVSANNEGSERDAVVHIIAGLVDKQVKFAQTAADMLNVKEKTESFSDKGGKFQIIVSHNYDYEIKNDANWIKKAETRAWETDLLEFEVAPNLNLEARNAIISICSKTDASHSFNVKIEQAGFWIGHKPGEKVEPGFYVAFIYNGKEYARSLEYYKELAGDKKPYGVLISNKDHQFVMALEDCKLKKGNAMWSIPSDIQIKGEHMIVSSDLGYGDAQKNVAPKAYHGKECTATILKWRDAEEGRKTPPATIASEYEYADVKNWYLPSSGELCMIFDGDNINEARKILKEIGGKDFSTYLYYWSSSQCGTPQYAWMWMYNENKIASNKKSNDKPFYLLRAAHSF